MDDTLYSHTDPEDNRITLYENRHSGNRYLQICLDDLSLETVYVELSVEEVKNLAKAINRFLEEDGE